MIVLFGLPPKVPPSSLLTGLDAAWLMAEAAGQRLDSGANGLTLTDHNTVTRTTGPFSDYAASFVAASSQYLSHVDHASLAGGNTDYTITAWHKGTTLASYHMIVTKSGNGGGNRDYELFYDQPGARYAFATYKATDSQQVVLGDGMGAPVTGAYYFLCAWVNSVAKTINLQVNGGKIDSITYTGVLQAAGTKDFQIGGWTWDQAPGGYPFYADGQVANVTMHRKVLTAAERARAYNGPWPWRIIPAKTRGGVLAYHGNSLTLGQGSSGNGAYPVATNRALATTAAYGQVNAGVGGQTTTQMIANAATAIDPYYSSSNAQNILCAWEVTNELYASVAVATALASYATYCAARRAIGWKVLAFTLLPRSNVGTPAGFEADRQTVNTSIRANWANYADGLVDVAADGRIGDAGDELDTTYYDADKVHMNNTGYGIISGLAQAAILAL